MGISGAGTRRAPCIGRSAATTTIRFRNSGLTSTRSSALRKCRAISIGSACARPHWPRAETAIRSTARRRDSTRSSKDQGQSNFTNPGLALIGIGADVDVSPRWRAIANLNQLWFVNTSSLSVLRNQGDIDRALGTDLSVALQYRPLFNQNIVFNVSAAALFPGKGFKQLYEGGGSSTPYSILANVLLTY